MTSPAFVLVHPDYMESIKETLAIVEDSELLASIERSRQEAEAGRATRLEP